MLANGSAASRQLVVSLRRLFPTRFTPAVGAHGEEAAAEPTKRKPNASNKALAPALLMKLQSSMQLPQYCCGCGVKLQQQDPDAPG